MIVREDEENTRRVLDSIQGLYDKCIIAVDSRPESDKVFDLVSMYPGVTAYRQVWPGRFDTARQDVLTRVNNDFKYVGCCDSDEVLVEPSPREVRKFLLEKEPKAINVNIRYSVDVGPNFGGDSYLRTKIWNLSYPRKWVGRVHEYPQCLEYYDPTPKRDIIFEHLKVDHKSYRSELIIENIIADIKEEGLVRWYPYLAQEYRAIGKFTEAIESCKSYISLENAEDQHLKVALEELMFNLDSITPNKWKSLINVLSELELVYPFIANNPIICEYLATCYFHNGERLIAKYLHNNAKSLDILNQQDFIYENDSWLS